MARYAFGTFDAPGVLQPLASDGIARLVRGRSVLEIVDAPHGSVELRLSGEQVLQISSLDGAPVLSLIMQNQFNEPSSIPVSLGNLPQRAPLRALEKRLRGLRTAYAILYLAEVDRLRSLEEYLLKHPYGDIEHALLSEDERLYVESISFGSWTAIVRAANFKQVRALLAVPAILFERGREAYLKMIEARAVFMQARAAREVTAAAQDEFNLEKERHEHALDLVERIDDPEARAVVYRRLADAAAGLLSGEPRESRLVADARRNLLGAPQRKR